MPLCLFFSPSSELSGWGRALLQPRWVLGGTPRNQHVPEGATVPRDITRAQPPEPTLGFIPSCPPFLGLGKGERLRSSSWGERDRLPPPPALLQCVSLFFFHTGASGLSTSSRLLHRGEGDAVAAWHMSQSSVGRGTPREQRSPSTFWESPPLPEPALAGLKPPV